MLCLAWGVGSAWLAAFWLLSEPTIKPGKAATAFSAHGSNDQGLVLQVDSHNKTRIPMPGPRALGFLHTRAGAEPCPDF